jgi:hypothetical protein
MICVFVGFSRIFLLGILIFKGLTARRLHKSFGVKGLIVGWMYGWMDIWLVNQLVL